MRHYSKRRLIGLLLSYVALLLVALANHQFKISQSSSVLDIDGYYPVTKVEDGDTIEVSMQGHLEKVRLIGVDTPEVVDPRKPVQCFGKQASAFTKSLVTGKKVKLMTDSITSNRDRYDRLLRYVYLEDGRLLNSEIIKGGYGFAYTAFPFTKVDEFSALETTARQNNAGLWQGCETSVNQYGGLQSSDVQ